MLTRAHRCFPAALNPSSADNGRTCEHFVQFYRTEDYLIECGARFVAEGLLGREAVVVIALPDHRQAVEARLPLKGIDLQSGEGERLYRAVDARRILNAVIEDGRLAGVQFRLLMTDLLRSAIALSPRVRVFNELAAWVAAQGHLQAALEMEHAWNALGEQYPMLSLFCAYPSSWLTNREHAACVDRLCEAHTRIVALTS